MKLYTPLEIHQLAKKSESILGQKLLKRKILIYSILSACFDSRVFVMFYIDFGVCTLFVDRFNKKKKKWALKTQIYPALKS